MKYRVGIFFGFLAFVSVFLIDQGWISYGNKKYLNEISITELKERLSNDEIVVLISTSDSECNVCTKVYPKMKRIANKVEHTVYYVDISNISTDEIQIIPEFSQEYNINSIPTLLHYKEGKLVYNITGDLEEKSIKNYITGR
ncbi:thioredoxin family protein [Sutcliffiella halmapala]